MSLMLSPDITINENVPKEYNMQITNQKSQNTYVFTEKDLPGFHYKSKGQNRQSADSGSQPFSQGIPRVHLPDRFKNGASRIDKGRRGQPYYRKAVPSMCKVK
jgi:transcription initiation factor TFIIF subunit beta